MPKHQLIKSTLSRWETASASLVKTKALMFFASALLQTKCVEDLTCETAWTNMVVIGYNPKFIESLDVPVVKFVVVHELMHILLKHGLRVGDRDRELWNIAGDYEINILLYDQGFTLWPHALIDYAFRGMSAEQIYEVLKQEQSKGKNRKGNSDQGGLGGDLRPVPVSTSAQAAEVDHQISKILARAAAQARQYGVMPGQLEAIISAMYEDPVPWEQVLIDYMTSCLKTDETWSRRNRRYSDVILPACKDGGMEELTIIADSSGSMFTKEIFERIAVAVNHVVTVVKPLTVRVIWADDDECSNTDLFEVGDEVALHPKGGGGTDMRKPLTYVAEHFTPEVVLMFTDGWTPWPEEPTPYPLIIGCTTNAEVPDWAGVVRIGVGT